LTTKAQTVSDQEFTNRIMELEAAGNSEAIAEAFLQHREQTETHILAATHGKRVPMPFAGLWAHYIDAGPVNDVFRAGDVLAVRESGSILPRQPVFVGFKDDPVRHVAVYLGVAMAGNRLLPALEAEGPAAVFWDGCETDEIRAAPLSALTFLMPIIGYTRDAEPFYPVNEWPVSRRALPFISALQSNIEPVELLVIADRDTVVLKPCCDGGSEVH
jgi:hypothetical protein